MCRELWKHATNSAPATKVPFRNSLPKAELSSSATMVGKRWREGDPSSCFPWLCFLPHQMCAGSFFPWNEILRDAHHGWTSSLVVLLHLRTGAACVPLLPPPAEHSYEPRFSLMVSHDSGSSLSELLVGIQSSRQRWQEAD